MQNGPYADKNVPAPEMAFQAGQDPAVGNRAQWAGCYFKLRLVDPSGLVRSV